MAETLVRRYYDKLSRKQISAFKKEVKETLGIELKTFRKHTDKHIKDFSFEMLLFVYDKLAIPKFEIVEEYPLANILLQDSSTKPTKTKTTK